MEKTVVDMASGAVCEEEEEPNKINETEEDRHIGDQKQEEKNV